MMDTLFANDHWYTLFKLHWLLLALGVLFLYRKNIISSPLYAVTRQQITYFHVAIALFIILKATPLDVIGTDYLFSMHTFQLSIIYFVVVPLALLGLPVTFLRKSIWHHQKRFVLNMLAHPWLTLVTFNGLISIYFIPTIFNFIHGHVVLFTLAQLILGVNAFFMWWVIMNPVPEIKGLNYMLRALYIFLASAILMPTGFFYIVIQKAHFPHYIAVEGQIIPALTAVYDQQLAGGLLKFIQIFSYAIALLIIFFKWGKQEEEMEGKVEEKNIRYARGVVIHLKKDD
jgi:putative membrane protein